MIEVDVRFSLDEANYVLAVLAEQPLKNSLGLYHRIKATAEIALEKSKEKPAEPAKPAEAQQQ